LKEAYLAHRHPGEIPDRDREVKWHCKYARQNGIHVSPTFVIDRLVQADMRNGDPVGRLGVGSAEALIHQRQAPPAFKADIGRSALVAGTGLHVKGFRTPARH